MSAVAGRVCERRELSVRMCVIAERMCERREPSVHMSVVAEFSHE